MWAQGPGLLVTQTSPHIIKPVWVEFLIQATERIQAEESWLISGTGVRFADPPMAVSRGHGAAQALETLLYFLSYHAEGGQH